MPPKTEHLSKDVVKDRRFVLNRKCFAVLKAIGPGAEEKWKYIHVGPKGCTATDTVSLIRVTLPNDSMDNLTNQLAGDAVIFPLAQAKSLAPKGDETVTMPEGIEAKTTARFNVPDFDVPIPDPSKQTASITVNAERLIRLLKAATEVTEHSRSLVRLRFYNDSIRIDAFRDNGGQEFMALLMGTNYKGNGIPGDPPSGGPMAPSEEADEKTLKLPVHGGRKFRD